MTVPSMSAEVNTVFENYSERVRKQLWALRETVFTVAERTEGVGPLQETLKWRQISYLTSKTKSGSTIRMDAVDDDHIALYFICTTTLVDDFRQMYGDMFEFEGNRCMHVNMDDRFHVEAIERCIEMALTYHLNKKNRQ